jgi:glycolate oxidase
MTAAAHFLTNTEIVQAARAALDQDTWDYLVGGSESETALRRNRLAFDKLAFRPRILNDVAVVDPSAQLLGHRLRIPVLLAPVGSSQRFHPDGAAAAARAAAEFGTISVASSASEPGIEAVGAASAAPKIYQLYVNGDWEWTRDVVARVRAAGFVGFCVCVDNAVLSRRERGQLQRLRAPATQGDRGWRALVDWDLLDRIRAEAAPLPFLVKGIATAEDAAIAVQHGAEVVWVSNHGGRQLDFGRGTMEFLPEIVAAVGGRASVILDGGIQRGSDVLKALALGAEAVAIGKLEGWGLAAGGSSGVVRVLEILEDEIRIAMALLGVTRFDQLHPGYLRAADPVMEPHEMSQFVHLPGGRLT